MPEARIALNIAAVVGDVLGTHYFSHNALNTLFLECGAPGEPPDGNCITKCTAWLKRASADPSVDAHGVLGGVLAHFMDEALPRYPRVTEDLEKERQRVRDALSRAGLTYHAGGRIIGGTAGAPTRSLEALIRAKDLRAVEVEFDRALDNVLADPAAAITAACAILESLFKIYIQDESLEMPADQSVKPLWKVVQRQIGLDPALMEDDDLKRILTGLASVVDGLGALRTHTGSAHGRGRRAYAVEPRHARLAVHSAHSLAGFVLETWDRRREARAG